MNTSFNDEKNLNLVINKIMEFKNSVPEYIDILRTSNIILEDSQEYDESKVGWTDWNNNIHIRKEILDNYFDQGKDTFIFQVLAHEMVHVKQYSTLIGKILTRSILRFWAEKQAKRIGEEAEAWANKEK